MRAQARWHFCYDGKEVFASESLDRTSQDFWPIVWHCDVQGAIERRATVRPSTIAFDQNKGWLAPSVENRIQAHMSRIDAVCRLLPVTKIVIETASFDIQKIRNPGSKGRAISRATSLDSGTCARYVLFRDGHVCPHCHGRSGTRSSTCIILRVGKRAVMRQTT